MPTDQAHIIAFLAALSGIALLGVGAFAYIWRTTPKRRPRTEQWAFDFPPQPPKPASTKVQTPPMAGV